MMMQEKLLVEQQNICFENMLASRVKLDRDCNILGEVILLEYAELNILINRLLYPEKVTTESRVSIKFQLVKDDHSCLMGILMENIHDQIPEDFQNEQYRYRQEAQEKEKLRAAIIKKQIDFTEVLPTFKLQAEIKKLALTLYFGESDLATTTTQNIDIEVETRIDISVKNPGIILLEGQHSSNSNCLVFDLALQLRMININNNTQLYILLKNLTVYSSNFANLKDSNNSRSKIKYRILQPTKTDIYLMMNNEQQKMDVQISNIIVNIAPTTIQTIIGVISSLGTLQLILTLKTIEVKLEVGLGSVTKAVVTLCLSNLTTDISLVSTINIEVVLFNENILSWESLIKPAITFESAHNPPWCITCSTLPFATDSSLQSITLQTHESIPLNRSNIHQTVGRFSIIDEQNFKRRQKFSVKINN
ncbi:unnamed protein product [Rotaria sp. Silwood1]|nr:unnamed protein product [Rotaria sp. Silwood1]CAF1620110.1 unnamed protein product [Rotaria sp. Silwood1]CAF3762729.1 unnamed protein product [Rotaria sp. Silwood1]